MCPCLLAIVIHVAITCTNRHQTVTILQINQVVWFSVRAAEAKLNFPTRHDWDSWFRDAKNMNEMKPGERPDTVHFKDLPSRWFANKRDKDKDSPSKYLIEYLIPHLKEWYQCVTLYISTVWAAIGDVNTIAKKEYRIFFLRIQAVRKMKW